MATIRVRDWTKERIEEIRDRESHSSHDSVIKTLLKDHELAKFAGERPSSASESVDDDSPVDTVFENLTVFAEMSRAENGVLFLWCPSCCNEIAHLRVENPIEIPVFEVECQRCLTNLDQHAIVGIEIGYPLEKRLVTDALHADLQACVIDYWDRRLRRGPGDGAPEDVDLESLAREFDRYAAEFGWKWPTDVPVVHVEVGGTYYDAGTDQYLAVEARVTEHRDGFDSFRVRRSETPVDLDTGGEVEVLDPRTVQRKIIDRELTVRDPDAAEPSEPPDG